MDWILMESEDFFTLSDCHRLYVKTLYACFFESWVCQAHVFMCSVSEMVLQNPFGFLAELISSFTPTFFVRSFLPQSPSEELIVS